MVGTGMLWVGWYGFNAGSAVAADGIAANAFMTTTLATAVASLCLAVAEWIIRGKPSVLGFCSGAVAGLVVITPACGFVTSDGAMIIGIAAGVDSLLLLLQVKGWFGYDDALDTFGVHAVGGTLGALLTGFLATQRRQRQPRPRTSRTYVTDHFQPLVVGAAQSHWPNAGLAVVGTVVIAYIVKAVIGLRVARRSRNARPGPRRTWRGRLPRLTAAIIIISRTICATCTCDPGTEDGSAIDALT